MRISSSSSFLLAGLAMSSSSSSLSVMAAPVGGPISRAVAANAPSLPLRALPSSNDIAGSLESRDLEERLDLASAVKPLPVVGDPLSNLLTTIGLGPAPTASEEDIDTAMQEMEQEIMTEMQAAFGETSIASLPADLNGALLGVVGGSDEDAADAADDDSLSNQALDDLPPLPSGITPPPGISEAAFLVEQALSGVPLPSGALPPQAVVSKIPQRRRPADPTKPPPRRQLGHEGSGQAASPLLSSPWSPDPTISGSASATPSAAPSATFHAAEFSQPSASSYSASYSARPTATFPPSFIQSFVTSGSASQTPTGQVVQAAAATPATDSKDGRPWWSPSRRASQGAHARAVYEALAADGLASPKLPTQPPNTPMPPYSGET